MIVRTLSVAMLANSAAFADIVCRTLEERPDYRVPRFSSVDALTTFMRIAPVHVVVLDTDLPGASASEIVQNLRGSANLAYPLFKIIVLTRAAKPFQQPMLAWGADVVLQKPVSPRHLLEAIDDLCADRRRVAASGQAYRIRRPTAQAFNAHPAALERGGKVIPLFGESRPAR